MYFGGRWGLLERRRSREIGLQLLFCECVEWHLFAVYRRSGLIALNQDHSRNLIWMLVLVPAHEKPTHGVANEHERRIDASFVQSEVKIMLNLRDGIPLWPWVTPTITSTIIGAHPNRLCDLRLNQGPIDGERACSGLQNQGRAAAACAIQVQLTSANVHQPSGWWR